ncbi:hypothetical protein EVAR_101184_1 [Eumeta japonica]|uniref:Uncharacterized protein n=1 Tax=Eumeta variegata TaxID=151549 RepID=A0A4C1SNB3_EUMVA|nr:hypothetical protein EVAR_101184_1 [Eumeta japonica]
MTGSRIKISTVLKIDLKVETGIEIENEMNVKIEREIKLEPTSRLKPEWVAVWRSKFKAGPRAESGIKESDVESRTRTESCTIEDVAIRDGAIYEMKKFLLCLTCETADKS